MEHNQSSKIRDDPLTAAIEPAFKIGAACGAAGFLFGGAAGIIRGAPPILFATASSIQVFSLASLFTGFRSGLIHAWTPDGKTISDRDLTKASAAAGCLSGGTVGGVIGFIARGRPTILPGAFMFTLFGAAGQHFYNKWNAHKDIGVPSKRSFWKRMTEASWSPVKVMNNEEYAQILREKMLRVDVEISIIDDKISALKNQDVAPPTSTNIKGD